MILYEMITEGFLPGKAGVSFYPDGKGTGFVSGENNQYTAAPWKPDVPILQPEEVLTFLDTWRRNASNNVLAGKPEDESRFAFENSGSSQPGCDKILYLFALPGEYLHRLTPFEIGISHCPEKPLHGTVVIHALAPNALDSPKSASLLAGIGTTCPLPDTPKESRYTLSRGFDLPPLVSDLVGDKVYGKLLMILGIPHPLDPVFNHKDRILLYGAVDLLRERGEIQLLPTTTDMIEGYSGKAIAPGSNSHLVTSVMPLDKYRKEIKIGYSGKKGGDQSPAALRQGIAAYFTGKDVERKYIKEFGSCRLRVELRVPLYNWRTDTVMTYSEFMDKIQALVPGTNLPKIPTNAQRLEDMPTDIKSLVLTDQEGYSFLVFFSASTGGKCKNCEPALPALVTS